MVLLYLGIPYMVLPYMVLCNMHKQYIVDLGRFVSRVMIIFIYQGNCFHMAKCKGDVL